MTAIWAHRGASVAAPENTMAAFEKAIEMGADGVEFDVQRSADGHLVVIHDETVDRTSDGTGRVVDLSLDELRRLDVGGGERIPLLAEVLDLFAPTGMVVNVELKSSIEFYPGIGQDAIRVVADSGMTARVVYSSFNHYTLAGMRAHVPAAQLGLLMADGIHEPWDYARRFGAGALHPGYHLLQQPGYVEKAHEAGLRVNTWTVDDPDHIRLVASLGVDAIVTNRPDVATGLLR